MTRDEFKALKSHTRVKYIGTDAAILASLAKESKTSMTKGIVVGYASDYGTTSGWGGSKAKNLTLRVWTGGYFENVVPEDWIVMDDKRKDLARSRETRKVKATDARVRRELGQFSDSFRQMKIVKGRIDEWLNDIPLAERFRILTTLTEEQKAWLELLHMNPEDVINAIKKIADEDPAEPTPPEPPVQPTVDIINTKDGADYL